MKTKWPKEETFDIVLCKEAKTWKHLIKNYKANNKNKKTKGTEKGK